MAPRNRLTANTVAEGRAKRGVSKAAPVGADRVASWTILRDAMRRIAPQDEVEASLRNEGSERSQSQSL
jgi:hypothetical protein